ncbi:MULTISPECIES: hypothetical protein [unclassified Streptomyces]|uniref:hypothetical protein n=1 Tax=unclassified Streptomyces TaxID=2593676 RepID=UPI002E3587D1|nr:hypothetical protein [Streptomyces sp. NBC_01361]
MREERPCPGAQLRFTNADGMRLALPMLARTGTARRWESKRLPLRLFHAAALL